MSNIDKQALSADALEATGGSWVREYGEGWEVICCDDDQGENATANRKFVQSANPATVLALLDELEARDKQNAELVAGRMNIQRTMGVYVHAYEEAKEQIAKDVEIKARLCRESNSLHDRLREAEKRIAEPSGQKRLIGWRASDYTDETSDPELAKNWAAAIGVLPIFEGDLNTKLSAADIGKGE